jgi:2-dehydropantoate 2-reductase
MDAARPVRVLVLGTGAMATAVGGVLARRPGVRITLAGTWAQAIDTIAARGAIVQDATGRWTAPVAAVPLRDAGPAELVLVLAKSHQTAAIADVAARSASPDGTIVTLQNGLGNRETLERAAGPGHVAIGVTTSGATVLAPGEVRFFGGRTTLGEEPATRDAVVRLAALLCECGVHTEMTTAIDPLVWGKLAVNCSANPLTALEGCRNGELLADAVGRAQLCAAAREVGAVAAARGIRLEDDPATLATRACEATAGNRSSMLQDVLRGARTEIDVLNGAVAAEGRRLGVAVPLVEALWRRVRALEGRPVREDEEPAFPGRSIRMPPRDLAHQEKRG